MILYVMLFKTIWMCIFSTWGSNNDLVFPKSLAPWSNFLVASLGRSHNKGGVTGRAPSFVEFSTGVRSSKAVLSWVEEAVSREALGWKAEAALGLESALLCFLGLSGPASLTVGLGWVATDAKLLPQSWNFIISNVLAIATRLYLL